MVVMLVAVEKDLHVPQREAKPADVRRDEVRVRLGPAVDQNVALRPGNKDRGNAAGTDEIGVAVDPDRRRRLFIVVPVLADRGKLRTGDFDRRTRTLDLLGLIERYDDRQDLRALPPARR